MIGDIENNKSFSGFTAITCLKFVKGVKNQKKWSLPGTFRRLDWELGDWMSQFRRPYPASGN
jgi:hypothetical protein